MKVNLYLALLANGVYTRSVQYMNEENLEERDEGCFIFRRKRFRHDLSKETQSLECKSKMQYWFPMRVGITWIYDEEQKGYYIE